MPSWAEVRSSVESHGAVEAEGWFSVLDLERALRILASPTGDPARRDRRVQTEMRSAAAIIACILLLDYDITELRSVFGRYRDADKLVRKGSAWIASFLSGATPEQAEREFRRTA